MDIESLNTKLFLMNNEQLQAVQSVIEFIMSDKTKGDAMFTEIGKRAVTTERYISYQIEDRTKHNERKNI